MIKAFFTKHYEKIVLAGLLTVFISLLALQLALWNESEQIKVERLKTFVPPPPNYEKVKFDSSYNILAELKIHPKWNAPHSRDGEKEFTDLMTPYDMALCPYCEHIIPAAAFPKPNTLDSSKCPFCQKVLRAPLSSERNANIDTDGDGIPDKDETTLGLNPEDRTDGSSDADADGFTNYEEYIAKTKLNDPKSRPAYHEKFDIIEISKAKLPFTLKNVTFTDRKDVKSANVQFEIIVRRTTRGYRSKNEMLKLENSFQTLAGYFTIVEIIPGFRKRSNGIEENISSVKVKKVATNEIISLEIGKPAYELKEKVILRTGLTGFGRAERELYMNSKLEVGSLKTNTDAYEVVGIDQAKGSITLKYEKDGKSYTIEKKSMMQKTLDSVKRPPRPPRSRQNRNNNDNLR